MIEKVVGFKVGEQFFPSIEEAQKQELKGVLNGLDDGNKDDNAEAAAAIIIANKDKVIDILTMTPTSKPKARRINGGTKKRKTSPEATASPSQ